MSEKTIAAISTPPAAGGIGIIRISGGNAVRVADAVFRSVSGRRIDEMRPWTCALGHIADGDETIDECIATLFRAPHSYTGEDVVELSCHGGTYVTRRVLRAVLANGAEPAGPGEFTKRAYLNGRIDLSKAEAVMNIISARGEAALRGAVNALGGAVGRKIDEITASLVNASAAIAVWTDDPDEDVPAAHEDNLERVLRTAADGLAVLIRDYDNGRAVNEGVDTVICGSPNVGKSTLMNLLSGYDRSIVADMPGTTRDVVEDTVLVGDVLLRLADTAGIREDAGEIEALGVSRTVQRMDGAGLLIAVFDGSQPLTREDVELLKKCEGRRAIAVINKSDRGTVIDTGLIRRYVPETVVMSAANGEGGRELADAVARVTGAADFAPDALALCSERQRGCCTDALDSVNEALAALASGVTLDAVNICVDSATDRLLELTGKRTRDAVADEVFARFCVGK